MDINYKIMDTQRIIDYITSFPKGVSVEEIIQSGFLEVLKREELGAPIMVRKRIH